MFRDRQFPSLLLILLAWAAAPAVAKGPVPIEVRVQIDPAPREAWGPKAAARVADEAAKKLVDRLRKEAPPTLGFWSYGIAPAGHTLYVALVDARTALEGGIKLRVSLCCDADKSPLVPYWEKLLWKIGRTGGGYPSPKARKPGEISPAASEISDAAFDLLIIGEWSKVEPAFRSKVPFVADLHWARQTPHGIVLPLDSPAYDGLSNGSRFLVQGEPPGPNRLPAESHGKTETHPADGYRALVIEPSQWFTPRRFTLEVVWLEEYVPRASSGQAHQWVAPQGKP